MRSRIAILAAVLVASATAASAQVPVTAGARVRVAVSPSRARRVATVIAATPETLVVRMDDRTRSIPVDSITRLEISQGRHRHTLAGLGIGALAGATTGAIIGAASGDDKEGFIRFTGGEKAVAAGLALGLVGGTVGTIVGYATVRDTWVSVPTDRLRARIAGMPVRFGVVVRR